MKSYLIIQRIHAIAGAIGFLTILTFWTSTAWAEFFGTYEMIASVKQNILWGVVILIPGPQADIQFRQSTLYPASIWNIQGNKPSILFQLGGRTLPLGTPQTTEFRRAFSTALKWVTSHFFIAR